MKKLDNYISEKLIIDKNIKIDNNRIYEENIRTIAYMFSRISAYDFEKNNWEGSKEFTADIDKQIIKWVYDNKVKKFKAYYGYNSADKKRIKFFQINPTKRDEIINKNFIGQNKTLAQTEHFQLLGDENYLILFNIDDIKNVDKNGYVTATYSRVIAKDE